jgi:hypothetical protein
MEITKERLVQLRNTNELADILISSWYPDLQKFENGKWYKLEDDGMIINIVDLEKELSYGINRKGEWHNVWDGYGFTGLVPATDKEVEIALTREASLRGYKTNNFICLSSLERNSIGIGLYPVCNVVGNQMWTAYGKIYQDGVWAEVLPTITLAEAEERLQMLIK